MSRVIVGRWGKSLAIRVPLDVVRGVGLRDGEAVEVESVDGDIHIRREDVKAAARREAELAMERIIAGSKGRRLDGLSIRDLISEGRR